MSLALFMAGAVSAAAPQLRASAIALYSETKTGATGPVSAEKTYSDSEGSTRLARCIADYGILRVFAEAHAPKTGNVNGQTSAATASWQDGITINSPGLAGSQGTLTVKFTVDGSLTCTGGGDANRSSRAGASFLFTRDTSTILEGNQEIHYDGSTRGTPFLGTEQTATFTFTYGTPFDIKLVIDTWAWAYNYLGADALGDLSHTATWGGFVSVKDSNNNEVSNYTASSTTGANYVAAIAPPKPQLTIEKAGPEFQLSWSTNFTGYAVEYSEILLTNSWTTVTNSASPSGSKTVVTVPATATPRFFRLRM